MANAQRGEIDITLGGKAYTLRPTFDALCKIEDRSGLGSIPLLARFLNSSFGVKDAYIVISECLTAGGGKVPDNLGDLIIKAGLNKLAKHLMTLMTYAIAGEKELQAASGEDGATA